jgi:hypothetical protein
MKKFTLPLLVLLTVLMVFNIAFIDYSDLGWRNNWFAYVNLFVNMILIASLMLRYHKSKMLK